jgi:hypothetical protein
MKSRRHLAAGLLATIAILCAPTSAAQNGQDSDDLSRALAVRDQVIRNLIARIEQLERSVSELGAAQIVPAHGTNEPATHVANPPAAEGPGIEDQQLIRAAFERTLIDRGGLLLPEWSFELEPSASYAHSSAEDLVIDGFTIFPVLIVGDVFSERRRRETLTSTLTARLGLPWNSQLEVRVPWVYEDLSRLGGNGEETRLSDQGLGDLEVALSRDLPRLFGRGPQLLGSLRWKMVTASDAFGMDLGKDIPFGTGFQSLTAAVTGVSVLDPAVFFGTLSYTESLAADKGGHRFDPGSRMGLQFGMALALNLETSLSLAFEQSFTERTSVDGLEVPGTYVNSGTVSLGLSRTFPNGQSIDTSVAIGLSEDSPDLQLAFSMPFRRISR